MKTLTEAMRIYANDKATDEEKANIEKMYGKNYYALRYGDVIPEIGMKIKAGEKTVELTDVYYAASHNVIMVVSDLGKTGWPTIVKMIADGQATIQ
jgi:hypothetical protein